ncbi:MAG: molybdopterin-guanine dinucleotide biosynthesis protein B [Candidatus Helarchaeota archaeon]
MRIVSIIGKHNIGKTYLLEQILPKLISKYQVAIIKHTVHQIKSDEKGTDTFRLNKAGCSLTAISSNDELNIFFKKEKIQLSEIISTLSMLNPNIDILFLEGYKKEHYPKIIIIDDLDYLNQFRKEEILLVISKNPEIILKEYIPFNDTEAILNEIERFINNQRRSDEA